VLIWGDDQYENFREDVIPPFCVLSYDSIVAQPWKGAPTPNYWDEPEDKTFHLSGAREVGNYLTEHLLEAEFDVSYAYQPLHHASLPHAFLNAVLMLDRERTGFPYPLLPFAMNCYGRRVISYKGRPSKLAEKYPFDPPSPSPRRFFDLGAAIGRILHESPWRVALVASSSWSHAFLVDKHHRLYPDVAADRRLYGFLTGGELSAWRDLTLTAIEDSGQQEFLNWVCLGGAMSALGATLAWSDFVESHIFNSNKVLALFDVVE